MIRTLRALLPVPSLVVGVVAFAALFAIGHLLLSNGGARADQPVPVWGAVPGEWLDGLSHLHDGDPSSALRQLAAAEAKLGAAPPPLLRARLHAGILARDLVDAESTAEKLALRAGDEDLREFVVGLAEFSRAEIAGGQARLPGADPGAYDRAIQKAAAAAAAFQRASLLHRESDWPAARRNAERAATLRTELQRQRDAAERDRKREGDQKPDETKPDEILEIEPPLPVPEDLGLLSATDLQAMLQRLRRAEQEKRDVRRAVHAARSGSAEHDW